MKRCPLTLGMLLLGLCGCLPSPAEPKPDSAPAVTPPPAVEAPMEIPEQKEPVLEPAPAEAGSETTAASPAAEPTTAAVKMERLNWEQVAAIAAANPGKVVVLDLWATYCSPCVEELPGLVALQAKYPEQVVCVSVALDFDGDKDYPVEAAEADIQPVLSKVQAASIRNIVLTTPASDVYTQLGLPSIPAVFVYDTKGQKAAEFPDRNVSADVSYAKSITPFVDQLLKGTPQ